ncbi:MAG: M15 family metallopeptidase [Clostridia bacterium]|nr:M15 family metallopeptidase [Clostridia bacterium]
MFWKKPAPTFNTVKKSNRQTRRQRLMYSRILLLAIMAVAALLVLTVLIFSVCLIVDGIFGGTEEPVQPPTVTDQGTNTSMEYERITQANQAIRQGVLINVNSQHVFDFESKLNLKNIKSNRANYQGEFETYLVNNGDWKMDAEALDAFNAMMLKHYEIFGEENMICITSAYRSYQDQADLVSSPVSPGFSDHHTGLCVAIMVQHGSELRVPDSDHWIYQNCHKYGFVMRYPDEKKNATGLTYSYEYCLRYVGVAHATYMAANDLCLEEYTAYLASHTTKDTPLQIQGADKKLYSVYYVKADGDLTTLEVPKNYSYTISGDNISGFIVTVDLTN